MITPFKQKKESENIDIDAAARGLVTALTGKTEFDGVTSKLYCSAITYTFFSQIFLGQTEEESEIAQQISERYQKSNSLI